ncbi:MAG: histidine phosphatase family protein [Nanoarchaeota archaeon]|nr:histidine phosphatase family protein [Nanoarchaeota archaeon]
MRIIICRHGETDANLEKRLLGVIDRPLNEEGLRQAEILGEYLSQYNFSSIYSSSLSRSSQTAQAIEKYQKDCGVILVPEFNERNFGQYEMKTWKEVFKEIPDLRKRWKEEGEQFCFPGGEILSNFIDRVQGAFRETISKHEVREDIAYVAHGGSIKAMMGWMFGSDKTYIPHLCAQDNCSVNFFSFDGNNFKIHMINYTGYRWDTDGI